MGWSVIRERRTYEGFNLFNDGQGKVWISAVNLVNLVHHLSCEHA